AKPVIDIMAVVSSYEAARGLMNRVTSLGYYYYGLNGIPRRHYFKLEDGEQNTTVHLHVLEAGSAAAREHIAFRDYLRGHPETAAEYAALKHGLAGRHRDDRPAYTEAKAEFIVRVLQAAGREAGEVG
ncbi:MAG: GrpB family protein, partial [Tepidiformaceae bacterium]